MFHAWDEAHSAQRLCANALTGDDEISITDQLLVTGKRPYSLAKFLSTSMVFRETVGDQQRADQIAFVKMSGGRRSVSTVGRGRTRATVAGGKSFSTLLPRRREERTEIGAYSRGGT